MSLKKRVCNLEGVIKPRNPKKPYKPEDWTDEEIEAMFHEEVSEELKRKAELTDWPPLPEHVMEEIENMSDRELKQRIRETKEKFLREYTPPIWPR